MKKIPLPKSLLVLLAAPALLALALPAGRLLAQSPTDTKISLTAEALHARDSGDLVTAKKDFEALLAMSPGDAQIKRLLDGVNASIAAQSAKEEKAAKAAAAQAAKQAEKDAAAKAAAEAKAKAAAEAKVAAEAKAKDDTFLKEVNDLLLENKTVEAKSVVDEYAKSMPDSPAIAVANSAIEHNELHPVMQPIAKVDPKYLDQQKEAARLAVIGRSEYQAGDIAGAQETFKQLEAFDSNNHEAKYWLTQISQQKKITAELTHDQVVNEMIQRVADDWNNPSPKAEKAPEVDQVSVQMSAELSKKLDGILVPSITFNNLEISKVIKALGDTSERLDVNPREGTGKGVNFVLNDTTAKNPTVTVSLRNLSLKRVLEIICKQIGYSFEFQKDIVVVQPTGDPTGVGLETESFPVTKQTVSRMTQASGGGASAAPAGDASATAAAGAAPADPFAPAGAASTAAAAPSGDVAEAMKGFLQNAGVNFTDTPHASLAYDGSSIIVNQTQKNLDRIRDILKRYNDVKQVSIEAKFIEVIDGDLNEMGVNWTVTRNNDTIATTGRTLAGAFSSSTGASNTGILVAQPATNTNSVTIVTTTPQTPSPYPASQPIVLPIILNPPTLPNGINLGLNSTALGTLNHTIGTFDVQAEVRALSQKTGSELLSSPSVTVLSGNPASITVGQELRYPQSYGQAQLTTGNGGGVGFVSGTPQEFTVRAIGVELKVTPTVEEDDYSISLDLTPRVTEFEGFVEYGGPNMAASSGSVIQAPSGYFQPIFSTREITTKVTIWDGATLVMGGLTREERKKISDSVPVLGDIPFLGRLFQTKSEATQKSNLMVFVTANLVSPGGSLKKQDLKGVPRGTTFQSPSFPTPGGVEDRVPATTK